MGHKEVLAVGKKNKKAEGAPRHSTAAGRPQRAGGAPSTPAPKQGNVRPKPQAQRPNAAQGVPGQEAFQNIPRRKPPSHLPTAQFTAPLPQPPPAGPQRPGGQQRAHSGRQETANNAEKAEQQRRKEEKKEQKRRRQERVSPAKRRKRRRLLAAGFVLLLIAAGLVFSFSVLFKIERFSLQGESPYTQEEILTVFDQKPGNNMFGFTAGVAEEKIQRQLPYIEKIEIRRSLPGTVVFRVTPAIERYCLPWENGWAVLSDKRKVLRLEEAQPEGLTALYGVTGIAVQPGQSLAAGEVGNGFPYSYEEYLAMTAPPPEPAPPPEGEVVPEGEPVPTAEPQIEEATPVETIPEETPPAETPPEETPPAEAAPEETPPEETPPDEGEVVPEEPVVPVATDLALLTALLEEIATSGLTNVTWVDVSDPLVLRFRFEDRITVLLGARSSLPEKLKFVSVLLTDTEKSQITEGDRGVLDVSGYPDTTDRAWLTPE